MRKNLIMASLLSFGLLTACNSSNSGEGTAQDSTATASSETLAGDGEWTVLFDAAGLDNWHDYNSDSMSWIVEDGTLTTPGGKGDIVTKDVYDNFHLQFDWKISGAGNSGVLYLVQEGDYERTYYTGPEYQLIDAEGYNKANATPLEDGQVTGANYALNPPSSIPVKPVGEWNHSEIKVDNGHVEHWLNGEKVVEYDLWTDQWKEQVRKTKFSEHPDYGMAQEGHIALQDHGDRVWFKDIRIRQL